ncbi:MAG TPA: pyruvate formate lyase family protein [Candidatus Latescibacteria bacterium]|nr:pyruvate formate lyase family protein [Candidatus Latescibacterota bacterium]HOS63177.1 pyruvate formate lyase family protein [Candidatus Latescibacterota bacterium]HPK75242.1 pyruvate formate lyase family protein [Candidatus Latescibacterota bacterium]
MQDRLAAFRDQAYARGFASHRSPKEKNYSFAFFDLYADFSLPERQARSLAYALVNEPVLIHPLSRIPGQIYQACAGSACPELSGSTEHPGWVDFSIGQSAERRVAEEFPDGEYYGKYFTPGGYPGHICWDFGRMLDLGIEGMLGLCERGQRQTTDPRSREFYHCVAIVLQGLLSWVELHVSAIENLIREEIDPVRRKELREMADVCRRVPRNPSTTFREAVQTFWFQHLAVMYENPFGGNGPGRLDYYLWPFLERDLASGRTTLDEARELVTELLIKLHERIAPADGWVEALPVGGRKPDGSLAINPLSSMIIEIISELPQTHPSVYVRLPEDAPDDFVDLTVRYLLRAGNRAQVYGDDAVIEALHRSGKVAVEDARHWTAGGCMEVSPQGCNCDLLFSFAHNVARTFELVINGGCLMQTGERVVDHPKTLADYTSFEELYTDFEAELARELGMLARRLDIYLEEYARLRPSFLLSSMTHDCLEKGRSINDGGARYTNYGGSGVGIPNVGDSLYAIQRAVFLDRRVTAAELLNALRTDFVEYETLQAYLRSLPKYGAGDEAADAMTDRVFCTFADLLASHTTRHGGTLVPIILGFVWVVDFGRQVGATPDGRNAGRPLAHGLSPQSGSAVKGITGAIRSATSLSLDKAGGGGAMMWDLDPSWAAPSVVKPLLKTFVDRGGHIFQGNVISVETLRKAQQNPDDYRDLIVRVAGWSARFGTLSPATQEEIITRYKYAG